MAEQPKYFDIEDTQTGKKYRVETDDPSATYEEAVEYFSTLPETDWQAFELKAPAKQAPAPAAVAPVSVASPAEEPSETDPYRPTPLDFNAGFTETFALESKDDPQVAALAESLWAQGIRDPEIYNRQIGKLRNNPEFSQFTNETIAQARKREAWYKARNLQTPGLFISSAPTGLEKEERPEGVFDTVGNALQRSAGQTYNSGVGLAALGADLVGADETSDSLLEEYILNNAKMELNLPRPVETYKDVDSFGAAGLYTSDTLGEFAPQLVGSLGFGALGKEAAKRIVAKSADDFVESQVSAGATREAAEAAAKKYVDDVAQKGALAGVFVSTAPQEIGRTFGETYAATGEKAPAMSIAAGLTSGSLDSILPAKILKNLSVSPQAITGKFRTELLKQGGKAFVMEGATEAAQEFIVSLPTSVIKGESPFTGEMLDRMTEAFIRGGIGGGTVGGTTATINYVRTARANSPPVAAVEGNIVIPSGKKNTKAYREQLATAQDQIVDQVNAVAGKWTNAPDVEVHANFSKLNGIDNDAIGVYTTKTLEDGSTVPVIKINTEAVLARAKQRDVSPESVVEAVTFHEGLGHHGLTQLFRKDLDAFLDDVYVNGAEEFRNEVDTWLRKNRSSYANYDPVSRRILATEEVLAGWSEKGPLPKTFVDNVLNLIKDFGRQMGVTFNINKLKNIKYTSREVRAYLAAANDRTVSGTKGGATPSAPRNMGKRSDRVMSPEALARHEEAMQKALARNREEISDKARKALLLDRGERELSEVSPTLFRETSLDRAMTLIPESGARASTGFGRAETYMATNKDLALGQGINQGVTLEFSSEGLKGKVDFSKPASEPMLLNEGQAETIVFDHDHVVGKNLKAVTVTLDALKKADVAKRNAFAITAKRLEQKGWTKTSQDGKVTWTKPETNNKYMSGDERTPDTTSAGFKQPKADDRSRAEARKQLWKNKQNPDWNPDDPNGLPSEPKYMAGDNIGMFPEEIRQLQKGATRIKSPKELLEAGEKDSMLAAVIDPSGKIWKLASSDDPRGDHATFFTNISKQMHPEIKGEAAEKLFDAGIVSKYIPVRNYGGEWAIDIPENVANQKQLDSVASIEFLVKRQGLSVDITKFTANVEMALGGITASPIKTVSNKYMRGDGPLDPDQISADDPNGLPTSTFVPEAKARKYPFETGKPVTVEGLHGTSAEFEDFDPSNLGAVTGAPSAKKAFWFATRKETAQTYAAWSARDRWFGNERKPARVLKRAIRLDNPLVVDMKSSVYREDSFRNILDKAYEAGHDGVILRNAYDSGETSRLDAWLRLNFKGENLIAVFDPKNILRESPETGNKYMRGDGPLDPDQISADDLIEANNALDILNRLEYTPTVISPDQLESEAIARNLPPSDITRLVGLEPGKLMKKLFLYDVAATKLSDRAAKIKGDIDANGLTPERQLAYLETTFKLSELTAKIFDFQAEIGRTLAANRRVNFSRKRVKDLKTLLEQYGAEALADPETFMRYMAEIDAQAKGREKVTTTKDRVISIVNIPRAIMSSADLSAPLRQGVVFISYPQYWKSFAKMFTMLGPSGERNYKFLMEKIAKHPNYELMQKSRLAFSSLDGELSAREEDFQTELARKIPLFGKVVKASEQAYAGFLNKLRADMFNRFVEDYRKAGIEPDDETLKGIGKFINAGTGRTELPEFLRPSSTIINATFFSGRLMYSRVQMLNPWFYAKLPPQVRKEAARSMLGFAGIAGLVAGSVNALWPDDVETELDPRSSDFMKIKIDNTRFDIGGGFNQYLVLGARTATWMYNNSLAFTDRQLGTDVSEFQIANKITAGGDERKYGTDEFAQETLGGAIAQFLRSKLSPQASYFIDMINEQDVIGREFTVEGSLASRLVPMTASSIYDAYKEDSPVPMPVVFTATIFGVGVNTYTVPGMDPEKELKPPVTFDMKDLADGQNDLIRAEGGVVTLKPAARKRWEETLNNYYPFFVEEVAAEMGLKFEDMDDDRKKATVKEATKRARYNAKEDMMYELGLAE